MEPTHLSLTLPLCPATLNFTQLCSQMALPKGVSDSEARAGGASNPAPKEGSDVYEDEGQVLGGQGRQS